MTALPAAEPPASGPGSAMAWAGGLLGAGALLYLFRGLAIPLLLATLLAYFLNPLVARLQGYSIRRSVAVTAVFSWLAVLALGAGYLVGPRIRAEAATLASNLPALSAQLEGTVDRALHEIRQAYPAARRFLPAADRPPGWLERAIEERAGDASELAGHAGAIGFVVVLVPIFAFFLLRDAGRFLATLIDRLPPAHIETSVAVWWELDHIIGRYLRGLALDGLVIGAMAAIGLWAIGVPFPLLLGAFTAVVNPLPYLGTALSLGTASLVALGAGLGLGTLGWIVLVYGVIRLLDDVVVYGAMVGGSVHLHPMLVLAAILAGEQALGLLGMVIAIPLVTTIKESARLLLEHRRTLSRRGVRRRTRGEGSPHYVC